MNAYWAIIRVRFHLLLQYRAAAIAGFVTQFFWGLMLVMIYRAFYDAGHGAQPMALSQVVTYVWLGQAMLAMLPWNLDSDVAQLIRSGNVAYELVRPLDLYGFWYCRAVAMRTAPMVMRAMPMFLVAMLCFGMQPPASWASAGAWILATVGALLLGCAISVLLTISMLWTIAGEGLALLTFSAVIMLSGMLIPLPLMPDWAQPVLHALPFSGLVDTPFRLYLGHLPATAILGVLGHQLGWMLALMLLGRLLLARGVRRLVVQGG